MEPFGGTTSAVEVAQQIESRRRTAVEVVEDYIDRIERLDGHYRSVVTPMFDQARARAAEADAVLDGGGEVGPLHGVPFGIKDLYDTAGVATQCGSTILAGRVPSSDATAVRNLLDAGAIPLAKLAMTEFAGVAHHPDLQSPINPYGENRSPGGSSSGSGVAVAAGLVPFALGTDTVASIRNPAAWNGCVGFKPTRGKIGLGGVFPLAWSLDHVGPLTVSVEDARLATRLMAGYDSRDPSTLRVEPTGRRSTGRLRVGFDESFATDGVADSVVTSVREAVTALVDWNGLVVETEMPLWDVSPDYYNHLFLAEVGVAHRDYFPGRADEYGQQFREILEQAAEIELDTYIEAIRFKERFINAVDALFSEVDVLVTPVTQTTSPPTGRQPHWTLGMVSYCRFTYHWNLAGCPAIAIPWSLDSDGLPTSVQIIGPPGSDELLLDAAGAIERTLPRPPSPSR